jgi:hypothetical protein
MYVTPEIRRVGTLADLTQGGKGKAWGKKWKQGYGAKPGKGPKHGKSGHS